MQSERGYTLIEVLIASTIYIVVLGIALGSLMVGSRLSERTRTQSLLTDTARSVADLIDREVRDATGLKNDDGLFREYPIQFEDPVGSNEGLFSAKALVTTRFLSDKNETIQSKIYLDEGDNMLKLKQVRYQGVELNDSAKPQTQVVNLLPETIKLFLFSWELEGTTNRLGTEQPFIRYSFTLQADTGRSKPLLQSMQSTVTSRAYRQ